MLQLVLAAPRSGSGKTTAACALLAALTARGLTPARSSRGRTTSTRCSTARCWASKATISTCFSATADGPRTLRPARGGARRGSRRGGHGLLRRPWRRDRHGQRVAAGRYAGPARTARCAAQGASLTLAAELRGLTAFRTPHHIAGILLNDCTQRLCALLKPMLEKRETGLPVVGCCRRPARGRDRKPPPRSENRRRDRRSAAQDTALIRCRAANHRLAAAAPCLTARARRCAMHGAPAAGAPLPWQGRRVLLYLRRNAGGTAGKRRGAVLFQPAGRHGSAG